MDLLAHVRTSVRQRTVPRLQAPTGARTVSAGVDDRVLAGVSDLLSAAILLAVCPQAQKPTPDCLLPLVCGSPRIFTSE